MTILNYVWILPRPMRSHYKGGFPLYFEKKLIELLKPRLILQPFGGMAEYGIRVDINPEVNPDIFADAHYLPFKDNSFDLVLCDPPYNEQYASKLYRSKPAIYKQYISEAVRVCKPKKFVASYHWAITPRPPGTSYYCRVFIGGRVWHRPRVTCVFQKDPEDFALRNFPNEENPSLREYEPVDLKKSKEKFKLEGIKNLCKVLACPVCKGELLLKEKEREESFLHCPVCSVDYPIKDGKPFLFPPSSRVKYSL